MTPPTIRRLGSTSQPMYISKVKLHSKLDGFESNSSSINSHQFEELQSLQLAATYTLTKDRLAYFYRKELLLILPCN